MSSARVFVNRQRDWLLDEAHIAYRLAKRRARRQLGPEGTADPNALGLAIEWHTQRYRAEVGRIRSASPLAVVARAAVGRLLRGRQA